MASSCIYNNQEECIASECDVKSCSRSSFNKLKCDICNQIINDHYYDINDGIVCEDCLENFKKYTDY